MEMLRAQCRRASVSSKKLDQMFSVYDQDGSGQIAYDEVQGMVKEFHCEAEGKDAAAVVLDRFSPSGAMNYDEFCTHVIGLPKGSHVSKETDPEMERLNPQKLRERISDSIKGKIYTNNDCIKKAFVMFDKDFGGSVSWSEFRDGYTTLGLPGSKPQVKQLFDDFSPVSGEIHMKPFSRQLLGLETGTPPRTAKARSLTPVWGGSPTMMGDEGVPRPKTSMDMYKSRGVSSRGASRLSIRNQGPGLALNATAKGSTPPLATPSQYLIRPNTGKTPDIGEIVSRRSASRAGSRAGSRNMFSRGAPTERLEPLGEAMGRAGRAMARTARSMRMNSIPGVVGQGQQAFTPEI